MSIVRPAAWEGADAIKQQDYANVNTFLRVYENSLLTEQRKTALLHAADEDAFFRLLSEWGFFRFALSDDREKGELLSREWQGWILWIGEHAPETNAALYFSLRDTIHNLKVFLKEQITKKNLEGLYLPCGLIAKEALPSLVKGGAPEGTPEARMSAQARAARNGFERYGDLAYVDFILDSFYYKELSLIANQSKDGDLQDFTRATVDLYHLSLLLQSRRSQEPIAAECLASGGLLDSSLPEYLSSAKELRQDAFDSTPYAPLWKRATDRREEGLFDVLADDYLMELCKKAKRMPFGLFPIYAFFFAKLRDLKTVRLLLRGKKALLSQTELAKRMGGTYEL